ncbi:MAG: fumarylacetoacetate hydrolase family protein [Alphaproteobacteria bacterium]|nr:fumarylacetoacetate hydrolase family protein [Alphaproteobacteria bacterium]
MLRLGSASIGTRPVAVAQHSDGDGFIDLSKLCGDLGNLESLDDLLDLPDAVLANGIGRARDAPPDLSADDVALRCPLVRPARVRDGGIVIEHLTPAFEQMALRLRALGTDNAVDAAEALESQIAGINERPFTTGDRDLSTLSGPGDEIVNPGGEIDIELELACLIRRSEAGAPEIFGYTLYNDWTLRDKQIKVWAETRSLYGGAKNFAMSNTFGPMVVLASDCGDPLALPMRAEVNGEVVASGDLSGAVRSFPEALEHLFRDETISGHEFFGTGTILGGCLFEQGRKLPENAHVRLSCPAIGILENRVRG